MKKPNGMILWQGASLLDGAPIVAIAVGLHVRSRNSKTGAMLQTYILRSDVTPLAAINSGADVSICGTCKMRGKVSNGRNTRRLCYVNVGQGPTQVYKAYARQAYPVAASAADIASAGAKRIVRLGTYGDPAAVPAHVWDALLSQATAHTGYTHQWRTHSHLRHIVMASADSVADATDAHTAGFRTFRVAMPNDPARVQGEARCPASAEAGRKLTCEFCKACSGAGSGRKGSIVIQAHGGFAVMANVARASV